MHYLKSLFFYPLYIFLLCLLHYTLDDGLHLSNQKSHVDECSTAGLSHRHAERFGFSPGESSWFSPSYMFPLPHWHSSAQPQHISFPGLLQLLLSNNIQMCSPAAAGPAHGWSEKQGISWEGLVVREMFWSGLALWENKCGILYNIKLWYMLKKKKGLFSFWKHVTRIIPICSVTMNLTSQITGKMLSCLFTAVFLQDKSQTDTTSWFRQ